MSRVRLTFACSDYDHIRDFVNGDVVAPGIDFNYLKLTIEETFYRFVRFREWDVSEMSMGKYVSLVSQNDPTVTAIPVFPSRVFRQSSLFVRAESPIKTANELRGKRVGIPEWAQTASIYTRGWLVHQIGIPLQEIEWIQAGVNQPGRVEKVELKLPAGVRYAARPDKSLTQMLLAGEIDAVMAAHPPEPFEHGDPSIVQLFPDYRAVEEAYYRETRIFPIMHVIALRRDSYEANRWIAMNLFKALEEAKNRSMARALEITATRFPFAWCYDAAQKTKALVGEDFFPYGIEKNRTTLEAFLRYAHEQGVCHRKVSPEELFAPEVQSVFKV
ncbi:MAG: 4,5-dihydroxyphthalate decarboxylase [Alphaproteobacteria bacterium]|nr:4,5-dihydroxyphthalate decarboxylase [Alphaproteobacteria bacterium]